MFVTLKFLSRSPAKLILCAGVLLFIGACQSPSPTAAIFAHSSIQAHGQAPEQATETKPQSQLTAELLYDLLVASIASQRNRPIVAQEALSSAAYQSRDHRIISGAIQLAMDLEEYQQAMALAQFFNRLQPDNYRIILSLAKAQFKLGEHQNALALLIDLVKNQTAHNILPDILVLQDIAALLSAQNQKTVLPEFIKYVEKNSANEQLTLTAALLASRLGNADEFIRLLDKTLELKSDWEFPGTLKLSELSNRDLNSMTSFAENYLKANPEHEKFKFQYARLLIQQDNIDSALDHLKEILVFNPDSADTLFTIGIIYLDKDLLAESKKALERYLELNLKNDRNRQKTDQSRIYLADIEFELKNYSAAALHLHGVSSQRYYLDAQVKMAWVIAQRDDIDSALNHLQQIYTANDDQRTRIILEQDVLLREHNQLDRSRLVLNEGLEEFPEHPDLLYNRGLLAAQMELLELHEQDMRKLIGLQPDNAHAYNALGYTLADQTDRLDEAMDLIAKANELLPDNGFILDSMGWVHFRLGHNEQAIKFLRQALEVRQDAEIAAHLGEVLWVTGHKDEALKIWQQGTEWGPENSILKNTIDRFSQQQSTYFAPRYYPAQIAQQSN
ncbi:tetratricopeptide repeat protein [Candidatus Spongiihabitans sp.]|uniref:tetratricopeptide repeat protein n=1 Tax=Candidatus Spongiihabitans sp. TaxID=3101308 RepID=UPI003C6FCC07